MMTREVPSNIGELSTYALQRAIDKIDGALKDAPQDVRDAIGVVRLVESVPRRSPWYGITMWAGRMDDQDVQLGMLLSNIAQTLEYVAEATERPVTAQNAIACAKGDAGRLRRMLERGKREYDAYLDRLFDPQRWEEEQKCRRLREAEAAVMVAAVNNYRNTLPSRHGKGRA